MDIHTREIKGESSEKDKPPKGKKYIKKHKKIPKFGKRYRYLVDPASSVCLL